MQICTVTLSAGENITINRSMNVVQFSVIAGSSSAVAGLLGSGTVTNVAGTAIPNETLDFSSGQGYNSIPAFPSSPWDGITITCSAGIVNVILTTD